MRRGVFISSLLQFRHLKRLIFPLFVVLVKKVIEEEKALLLQNVNKLTSISDKLYMVRNWRNVCVYTKTEDKI